VSEDSNYSPATVLEAEGARVGFVICKRCGAALLLDPRDKVNPTAVHDRWHTGVI
jgi:hypothetical protein